MPNPEWCEEADEKLVEKFLAWKERVPRMVERFVEVSKDQRVTHDHYSPWGIANILRYHNRIAGDPKSVFKVQNDFIALLARYAMHVEPTLKGFFETRGMKKEGRYESREEIRRREERKRQAESGNGGITQTEMF